MRFRRTVAIDFDGVIHKHVSKWTVPEEIHDGPVDGALDFIERVLEEFNVVIFSARASDALAERAMSNWLCRHWLVAGKDLDVLARVEITSQKPHAFIYIDDRGWHFEGTFPTMEELRSFESWTKKPPKPVHCRDCGLTHAPGNHVFGRRFRFTEDGYKDYGNLSAVDPPYQGSMTCEKCKTRWLGCWDNFQCPECGEGELPRTVTT